MVTLVSASARAVDARDRGKDLVLRALPGLEAAAAAIDEFRKGSAEPGHGNLALRYEGCEQLLPLALVAIEPPALDQLRAGIFVARVHVAHIAPSILISMRPIDSACNWVLLRCLLGSNVKL
jgi:hypothetical protein